MNLGKAFSIPQKHGFIQNGDIWISTPPENPVLQITNHAQSEMPQNQIIGSEDWQDLLGIYTGLLQNKPSNATPQNFNQSNLVGPKNSNPNGLIDLNHVLQHSQAVDPVMAYNGHFHNFDPTGPTRSNPREYSTLNQKEGITGSFIPPRKVDTLAELMGMKSVTSNGAPYTSTNIVDKPIIICPHSQGESNTRNHASLGVMRQQDHVVHANCDIGVNNLQETPNGRLSAPYRPNYNLNLPPGSEAGESSSTSRPFPLGPVTPDQQKQSNTHQIIQVPDLLIDEMYTPEKYKQGNIISTPKHPEILEKDHNELLKNNSEDVNGGIDLNKTPQQKTPKRKKHRPKVVIEGKPKKTPKPAVEKSNTPSGIPTPKRKYTRKNGVKTSTNTSTDPENVVEASTMERPTKSCKRALNFDLDNGAKTESLAREFDNSEGNKRHFNLNLNLDSQIAEWSMELNGPSISVVRDGQQNTHGKGKQQTEIAYNFVHSVNRSPPQESLQLAATTPPPTYKDRALNIIARSLYTRNASINNSGDLAVILANTSEPTIDNRRQSTLQIMPHVTEKQGREHVQAEPRECQTIDLMDSRLWSRGISETRHSSSVSNKIWQNGFINGKKTKGEDKFHATSFSIPSGTTNVDISGQTESRGNRSFPAQSSIMHQNGGLTNSHTRGQSNSRNSNNKSTVSCDRYMNSQDLTDKFQQQHTSSQVHSRAEKMPQNTYHHLAKEQIINSLTTVTNWNPESASKRGPKFVPTNEILNSPDRVAVKKRTAGQASSKKVSIMDKNLQQDAENWRNYGHSTKKVTGSQDKINLVCVDYLTDRMKDLHIHGNGKEIVWKEQNALVPFKGDGAIVSYEEFNPVKKRRPRPRVDLDPETNRLWNLLMGKEGSESAETMDNDKQKWWEEERKVFRGRVDSFIARMHLVQGDRRFSKWKGSVVDSVIGVFLTQNVSDHLSSSAFMSLAAKFPLKARTMSPSVEHHEVRITFPDETTTYDHKLTRETEFNNSSVISKEASKHEEGDEMRMRTILRNDSMKRAEEDVISSQNSSESIIFQASEDIKSSSGSNSEIDDEWNISKNQTYQTISNQSSVQPSTNSYPNMSIGLEEWEARVLSLSGEESISSFSSAVDLLTSSIGVGHPHDTIGQSAEISFIETPKSQPNKHVELQTNLPDGSHNRNGQHLIKHRQGEIQETFQQESAFPADPTRPAEVLGKQPSGNVQRYPNEDIIADNQKHIDNITHKPTEMGKTYSSGKPSTSKTTPNERKRKAEKEKAEPFNWDILRKQVESMAGTRERSRAAMDSLDYEALRNADVREISDTIKERGMNNMLAERIKDFLNRLVRDHEKVDLEWLRDVQPDKSKDYLLSIRGLGLKSVECVRLLTLHHLAFPVDTNVGRIAVRLGWVPLQPLPESLQLHLLEMYPVLDSIQKYLWPRLCKLDQETLYELHYQMITFGKVFCTKRDPNCNACPMRAECRHFASAFASARLALPGPDERRIVTSATPTSANKSSNVTINPIGLLPSEDNLERGMGLKGNCEPLIEEPKTPEPPIEVSERDIEDAFYEDPDEIPVIKLNVEEFTSNLQSFMQEQMEIGEDDMSKALVALSPEFASIPTPKLKHVSRLRTEHQVYELPDSHPLLKDMDRREPDDPSPYLLAIWTPGETADSVQPPERTCGSQEGGGLCNKTTCFACNSAREAQAQTVRGTILMPCRTAMRGSFPLNGTYFQVNEVFADHESSLNPIDVPRNLLWNLPRRTVFFGTSVTSIFKGLSTEDIQFCFWKGFVCVRGFDQKTRAPRPLKARLHLPASKMVKQNE